MTIIKGKLFSYLWGLRFDAACLLTSHGGDNSLKSSPFLAWKRKILLSGDRQRVKPPSPYTCHPKHQRPPGPSHPTSGTNWEMLIEGKSC